MSQTCCQVDRNGFDPVIERFKQLVGIIWYIKLLHKHNTFKIHVYTFIVKFFIIIMSILNIIQYKLLFRKGTFKYFKTILINP